MKAVTFRLAEKDIELLKSYAETHGITQAEAIRAAIQNLGCAIQKDVVERADDGGSDVMAALVGQLAVKDGQIADLNARFDDVSKALLAAQETAKAAQALHAANVQERALESSEQKERRRWRWPWDK